jgi:hypothetical protein
MPPRAAAPSESSAALVERQAGVVSRLQALELGLTDETIEGHLSAGRWQKGHPGVYLTFTGPISELARVWAAIRYAGRDAMASHETAAWLAGLQDDPPALVHVTVPAYRRVHPRPGLRIHISTPAAATLHPARQPPQTRLECTVIDCVASARRAEEVIDVVTRACQRRLTTAARLAAAAAERPKLPWRGLLAAVLADVRDGVLSMLERKWRHDVERAHGLPAGEYNRPDGATGARRYRDVRYREYHLIVELDGTAAHPDEQRHRDMARDNLMSEDGEMTLRYSWHAVAGSPCEAATQTARVLRRRGWQGHPRRCGADCRLPDGI